MAKSNCILPIHPRTHLTAVGILPSGKVVWPAMGGDDTADAAAQAAAAKAASDAASKAATDAAYTAPASQADLDRIVEQRLARERAKFADYEDLKTKAAEHDELVAASRTEHENAIEAAKKEARESALKEARPGVVKAEFKAAAKGVLSKEQLDALVEDLDLTKYITDKGDVDEEKIAKKVAAFAPAKGGTGYQARDLGQGNRQGTQLTARELGAAEAAKRFPKKA